MKDRKKECLSKCDNNDTFEGGDCVSIYAW